MNTFNDYRRLGSELDEIISILKVRECGSYKIPPEKVHSFLIVESMTELQEALNKGLRVITRYGNSYIEIYDVKERQEKQDKVMEGFFL